MNYNLINNIDRAVCLTLDTRIETAINLQKVANLHSINLELFIAGNGHKDLKYDYIDTNELPPKPNNMPDWTTWNKSPSMYNCFLCHRQIITQAYNDGCRNLLLMEDDAVFMPNFDEVMQKIDSYFDINSWSVIYLGSFSTPGVQHIRINDNIIKTIDAIPGFHCVLINRDALEIAKDFQPESSMDSMFHTINKNYDCYKIDPSIVGQKVGFSCTMGAYCDCERV